MKAIKVCFVTREYSHKHMGKSGGIGVFLKQFTEQLKDCNYDITIFSFGDSSIRFDDDGVNVVKIKDLSAFNVWVREPFRRYKLPGYVTLKLILEFFNRLYVSLYASVFVWKHQFDLIEFHDYGGDAPYFTGRLPKVVRCHGTALTLHQFMGYVNRVADSVFEKQFFKRFHQHVIAVSHYSADTTQQAFGLAEKPKVIYNGVRVPNLLDGRYYLDAPTLPFSVFYFGSIRERKGIDIACKVFNTIIDRFPEASFHVMGNNNNDHWHTQAVKILTPDALQHTTYYGAIPNEHINVYLQKAHVVLFPSFGENFSIALLEVMALGKLAITSNIPAFHEIIKDQYNGFIASSFEDYIEIVTDIFNNKIDLDPVSQHARSTIVESFESKLILQQNVDYYTKIIALEKR